MTMPFLSVELDAKAPAGAKLVMRDRDDNLHDIHTAEDFKAVWQSLGCDSFMCSSSVDFPDEYTNDESFIELCQDIRS